MSSDAPSDGAVAAPPSQASPYAAGEGWCSVKPEFIVPKERYLEQVAERQRRAEAANGNQDEGGDQPPSKRQKAAGGQNKSRKADEMGYDAGGPTAQFCRAIMLGRVCRFGSKCRNSHDLASYLASKPADLGEKCYIWETCGSCPAGVSCRYGDSHTDRATGAQLPPPAITAADGSGAGTASGASASAPKALDTSFNNLPGQVMHDLSRKRYAFLRSPAPQGQHSGKGGAQKGGAGGKQPVTAAAPSAAAAPPATDAATDAPAAPAPEAVEAAAEAGNTSRAVRREARFSMAARRQVDLAGQIYVGPLTTVGNLPFRRIMVEQGADVTIGEMAVAQSVVEGSSQEWALLRRHSSEKRFGVQLAGGHPELLARAAELVHDVCERVDFIDINMGCPLDNLCARGMGAAFMGKPTRLRDALRGMVRATDTPITLKMRTGLESNPNERFAHRLVQRVRLWSAAESLADGLDCSSGGTLPSMVSAVTIHGRTRQQRYAKLADWDYISSVVQAARGPISLSSAQMSADVITAPIVAKWGGRLDTVDNSCVLPAGCAVPSIPIIGNGDILSWQDYYAHMGIGGVPVAGASMNANDGAPASSSSSSSSGGGGGIVATLLARGALVKPWLCREIREGVTLDPRSSERLEILRSFVNYGLDNWGSDQAGVNRTRRFLLEWLSFTCRYVPVGLLERLPQRMNERPPAFVGRDDLETLMGSPHAEDWVRLTEMLLGPVSDDFVFVPKHKSNGYAVEDPAGRGAITAAALRGGGKRPFGAGPGGDDDGGEAEG